MVKVQDILLSCTVLNYAVLLLWFGIFAAARGWMSRFHGRSFQLTDEQFDGLHYLGMAMYHIGILLFHLVPSVACE